MGDEDRGLNTSGESATSGQAQGWTASYRKAFQGAVDEAGTLDAVVWADLSYTRRAAKRVHEHGVPITAVRELNNIKLNTQPRMYIHVKHLGKNFL
jgi:hypothetical protein